jgi:hypothetical protein
MTRESWRLIAIVFLLALATDVMAVPLYSKDVYCNTEKCGTMEIDVYAARATATRGGVEIHGQFVPVPGNETRYHYLQAVIVDDAPLNYRDGTPIAAPYLDPPPGGYQNDPWDYLPWYDEGEFPTFYDYPKNPWTDVPVDGMITVQFETWLVCLTEVTMGDEPFDAKDDVYEVATLLGWSWGYTLSDNTANGVRDDLVSTRLNFAWLGMPSNNWIDSLDTLYGTGAAEDFFNIDAEGNCENCIPEPGTLVLLTIGLVGLGFRRKLG